jgi:hypothetical protein
MSSQIINLVCEEELCSLCEGILWVRYNKGNTIQESITSATVFHSVCTLDLEAELDCILMF